MMPAAGRLSNVEVITVGASTAFMLAVVDEESVWGPQTLFVLYTQAWEWRRGAPE